MIEDLGEFYFSIFFSYVVAIGDYKGTMLFWWKIMPQSHLHVKLSRKSHERKFYEMEWDMATSWQLQGLHGCYGSTWRLLGGCHITP